MVSLVVVGILILLVILFFRLKRMQHKFYAVILVLIIIFFYVTSSKIIAENDVDLKSFNGVIVAGKLYFKWLGYVFENTKELVGSIIKMDWIGD